MAAEMRTATLSRKSHSAGATTGLRRGTDWRSLCMRSGYCTPQSVPVHVDLIEMSRTAYEQFNPRLDKEGVMPVQEEACRAKQV